MTLGTYYMTPPWGTGAYICPNCKEAAFRLHPYCPTCGTRQNAREILKPEADRPAATDFHDIEAILRGIAGLKVRVWDYLISHCVLQLRVAHNEANSGDGSENTVIVCVGTRRIVAPTDGWYAELVLDVTHKDGQTWYRLDDKRADVKIECLGICIYEKMPAYYFM